MSKNILFFPKLKHKNNDSKILFNSLKEKILKDSLKRNAWHTFNHEIKSYRTYLQLYSCLGNFNEAPLSKKNFSLNKYYRVKDNITKDFDKKILSVINSQYRFCSLQDALDRSYIDIKFLKKYVYQNNDSKILIHKKTNDTFVYNNNITYIFCSNGTFKVCSEVHEYIKNIVNITGIK